MVCLSSAIFAVKKIKGLMDFSFVDAEDELLIALATHGPVAAAVNALSWQNYLGGVIQYHCDGSFNNLNHAVQIIGYDKSVAVPHYIIKNSWGSNFGDKGYMYIGIGNNLCGIDFFNLYLHILEAYFFFISNIFLLTGIANQVSSLDTF